MASNFQKMILSMIVGMRKQKEELQNKSEEIGKLINYMMNNPDKLK